MVLVVNGGVPRMKASLTRLEMLVPRWRHSSIHFKSPEDLARQWSCCRFSFGHTHVFQICFTCFWRIRFCIWTRYSQLATSKPSSKCLAICSKCLSRVAEASSALWASNNRSRQVAKPQAKTSCGHVSVRAALLGRAFIL